MAAFKGTDRYVVLRYLGSGSFGEVYEVFDRERQTKAALKAPHEATAGGLYYFKREFRSLVGVTHPNLAALYELVGDRDSWFFTMELIHGTPFKDYLRQTAPSDIPPSSSGASLTGVVQLRASGDEDADTSSGHAAPTACVALPFPPPSDASAATLCLGSTPPDDYEAVRIQLRQLAEGLMAIHRAGKLHRDIKPSNVLITEEGHLSILDFGLVIETNKGLNDETRVTRLIGTPAYMAPEQLEGMRGMEASDWYSVGVMLYEVLTGHQPYSGTLMEIVRKKVEQDPPSPATLIPGTPTDLTTLCMDLLSRDPAVRPTGAEILERLAGPSAGGAQRSDLTSIYALPALIGRDSELAALSEAYTQSLKGKPVLVQLHGDSGTGKTLLLRHFVQELELRDAKAVILQGRCYEQESVPYKAIDPLVDDLSRYLLHLPRERADALIPRNAPALARLFPVLNRIDALVRHRDHLMELDDAKTIRRRAVVALRETLGRLADRQPLVMIIDDLQWGDVDSAHLLRDLLAAPDPPAMLVVACYRTEEATSAPVLMELLSKPIGVTCLDIALKELSPKHAERLAATLLSPGTPEAALLANRIAHDSGGNPFFIGELAHDTQFEPDVSEHTENTLYGCIQRRVALLPEETQRIVQTLALAGHPLSWEVVKKASGVAGAKLPPASLLKADRLVRPRSIRDQQTLEIYHDFVRRAVLSSLGGNDRRTGHLKLAEVLESCGEGEPETLARHYILAGEAQRASEFTARAGDKAAAAFAFKGAADLYRRSLDLRPLNDPEIPDLMLRQANALSSAGLGREAAEVYLQLAASLPSSDRLPLQRRATEEYFRSGHFDQGVRTLKPVLSAIGMRLPSGVITTKLYSAYYAARLWLRGLNFSERQAPDIPPAELERVDICWTAVQGLGTGALMRGMDMQVRHLLLALHVGEPSRIIRALAHQTLLESMRGNRSLARTQRYQAVSLALAEKHGDPKLTGYAYMTAGIAAMMQGRWMSSCELLERAKSIYTTQCVAVSSELHQVHHNLLSVHFILGHFKELRQHIPDLIRDAEERGDLLAEANLKTGYSLFNHLAMDDPDSARRKLARAREIWSSREFHSQHWQALYLGGLIDQYSGYPEQPWKLLVRQKKALEASRLLDIQYIRLSWFEHKARIGLAYAGTFPPNSPEHQTARKVAHQAIKELRRGRTDYGYAAYLKLRGVESAVAGKAEEAASWFQKAQTTYETCHMPLHAHVVLWCRGMLTPGTRGTALVQEAETWMKAQGIVNPARYATMHAPCITSHPFPKARQNA